MLVSEGVGRFVGDRYHIVREIGRGGMGVVYLGRDLRRDMDVAIKFRHIAQHEAQLWLKREFRAVASLRHANLVELYELVAHERSCYFTMEYLEGVDPRQWVLRRRVRLPEIRDPSTVSVVPLQQAHTELSPTGSPAAAGLVADPPDADFSRVRAVLAQLAEGVAFLHARGVIHRDIKPPNVVVANDTVKLLDFGLALDRERVLEEVSRETRLVGTVAYLAPEYLQRLEVTPAIDVYALGVLAFELVTGAPPFCGTLHVLSRLARKLELPRARTLAPAIPADLDALIDEMLHADPARRPSALEVATRLTGALTQPRPVRRLAPFVGRSRELARLSEAFADREPRGRLVIVTGGSGSGKTALVEEALTRARQSGTAPELVWRGRCHERERVPYRAFDFVIDDLAAELAGDPRLAHAIEHAGALGRVFPSLGAILGAEPAASDLRVERERALLAMTQLFDLVLGAQRGLVVIDDLQWADEDSLELLALLVELVTRPLTIVATWTTDGDVPPAIAALLDRLGGVAETLASAGAVGPRSTPEGSAQVIALAPLGIDELTELVGAIAPHVPAQQLVAAARIAAGSPYLAEVIGRELVVEGVAAADRVEQRRLERLTSAQRDVAELTALATGATTFEQLRALADLPSQQLQSALRGLEDERVIRATPSPTGDPVYTFYHQRLRDAAHGLMSRELRCARHARFAQLLERDSGSPDQLSYHHEHAGDRVRAAHWAIIAANAARDQLAWSVAADGYARAIALGADDCRAARAECWFLAGKLAAAAGEFEALATTGGDHWRVRAAEAYIKLGELDRGLALVDQVLAVRGQPRARGRIRSALRTLGVAARWLGPVHTSPPPHDDVLVAAYRVIASFLSTPYPLEAFEYVLRGIATAERAGDRDAHALGMAMLAVYLGTGSLGRFGDRALARAHELSSGGETAYPRMVTAGASGIVATLRGDWTAMRRAHAEAQRICDRLGLERSWEASFLRTYEAIGEHYAGEPHRALAILEPLAEASDDMFSRALLGSHRGRALVLAGDLVGARAVERELQREPAARRGLAAVYRSVFAGELALAERDWLRAEAIGSELARNARDQWLSALPAISAMIDTLLATAELGRGDSASARRARRRARALYGRGRSSFYAATALRLWAQAERRLGARSASELTLARAAAVAAERGGRIDRLAIAALAAGGRIDDQLAPAVRWSCGGMIEEGT